VGVVLTTVLLLACGRRSGTFDEADRLLAEARYEEALVAYKKLGDKGAVAKDPDSAFRARLWGARALMLLGRMKECRDALEPLRGEAAGDPVKVAWTSGMFSMLLHREGDLTGALLEAQKSVRLAREAKDEKLEAFAVGILGTAQSLSGRYREAVESNGRQLEIDRRLGPPTEVALALNNLGIDLKHLGRFDEALASYDEALAIYAQSGARSRMAMPLLNAANVHTSLGNRERSLEMHERSLRISEETKSLYGQGINHNDIGELYLGAGNFPAAREHLEKALAIGRSAPFVYIELVALEHLGRLQLEAGDLEAARTRLNEALKIADAKGYGRQRVIVRALLARTQTRLGDGDGALALADEAVRQAGALEDPEAELEALEARAAVLQAAGAPGVADAYRRAIDLLESLRGRLALGDLRMGVAQPYFSVYEGAIRALMRDGRTAKAFDVAEHARARMLLQLMAVRGAAGGGQTREAEVLRKLREASEALASAPKDARVSWQREVDGLTRELAQEEEKVRLEDPASAAARYALTVPLSRLRSELLNSGRALLAFFWGEEDVYGWWIDGKGFRGARLGTVASLASRVDFLASALSSRSAGPDWRPPAVRIFADFVAPLAPGPADEILVVADGPLCRLPFETLLPHEGAQPWGMSVRFVYGPSASVLLALRQRRRVPRPEGAVLALGNPVVAAADGGRADPASRSDRDPLPFAEEEARDIFQLFNGAGSKLLLGREATLEHWKNLSPANFRYLHFATHAVVSDRHPQKTALLLSGSQLAMPEIQRLSLSAELVTLSACDTALGQSVRGEGVIGLPQAFLAAGARGVVVSLWKVEDRSTAAYMRDFYALLKKGVRPAEALLTVRRARAALPGDDGHPSRWAPFILVGGMND
jgi:tetratricopeptide (TPR) repeat protein